MNVALLSQSLKGDQVSVLKSFVQQAEGSGSFLTDTIPGFQSYAPQSGQIMGILKQLKEELSKDLSESQKAALKAEEEFVALKAAKEEEMAAGKKQLDQLEESLADFGEKHAAAAEELADTEEQLENDKTFLAALKKKCAETDAEYEERTKSRLEEIAAVQDTIKFLNSDEAFNMFDKTVNTGFVQRTAVSSVAQVKQQQQQLRD